MELQLGSDEAIAEPSGFDGDGLDVAGQLLPVAGEHYLQRGLAGVGGRAADHDYEVGRPGHGDWSG